MHPSTKTPIFISAVMVLTLWQMTAMSHSLYAAPKPRITDNCDSSSVCIDRSAKARDSDQFNNCNRFSSCSNFNVASTSDRQNNNCRTANCDNTIVEEGITIGLDSQSNNCHLSSCGNNIANGSSDSQNTACQFSTCQNNIANVDSNNQNTVCQSSSCTNSGINTNVYSNSASSCSSGADDTTTLCQRDRSFTFSKH